MNTTVESKRGSLPFFFAEWDSNPYATFLDIARTVPAHEGRSDYGWDNKGRHDLGPQNSLKRAFEVLGIRSYWEKRHANPENESFCSVLDMCFGRFFEESFPITASNIIAWSNVSGVCIVSDFPHPLFEKCLATNFSRMLEQLRQFDGLQSVARSYTRLLEAALFKIGLRHPHVFQWAERSADSMPLTYCQHLDSMFGLRTEAGKRNGYDSRIFDWLPKIIKAHRRMLRYHILSAKDKKGVLFGDIVFGLLDTGNPVDLRYLISEMNCDMRGFVHGVFDFQEQAGKLGPDGNPVKYSHAEAMAFLEKHAYMCPYPPI